MNSETYFFRYAFPCAHLKVELGQLSEEEYEDLEERLLNGNTPNKETLEKIFSPALRRIRKLGKKRGLDSWDFSVVREYWMKEHNKIIEEGEGFYSKLPESLKDLCRIHIAEIIKKESDFLIVKYDNNQRVVLNSLVPGAKIGERVTIHYGYAIEKVE